MGSMRISEAAQAAGTTPRALRWYEEHGLLFPQRSATGYRDYDERGVQRVRNIRELLDLGFTLMDLKDFVDLLDVEVPDSFAKPGSPVCALALEKARRRLAALDARIAAATEIRERLAVRLQV